MAPKSGYRYIFSLQGHFDPNETVQTLTVQVAGDTKMEGTEFFLVNLSNPVNASISAGLGFGSIS